MIRSDKINKIFIYLLWLIILSFTLLFERVFAKSVPVKLSKLQVIETFKRCTVNIITGDEDYILKEENAKTLFISDINSEKSRKGIVSWGTGFSLNSLKIFLQDQSEDVKNENYILTNAHVVEVKSTSTQKIFICKEDGEDSFCNEGKLIFIDKEFDLAILKSDIISCKDNIKMEFSPSLGSKIITVGNKLGLGLSVSFGNISALNKSFLENNQIKLFYFLDINAGYGNSGGAAFLENGKLIAILKGSYSSGSENANIILGISADEIKKSIIKMEKMFIFEKKLNLNIEEHKGDVVLTRIGKSEIFNYKDLEEGSIIQSFNGKYISSRAQLIFEMYNFVNSEKTSVVGFTIMTPSGKLRKIQINVNKF
jgi:S1-C subfamily serine protease